MPRQRQSVMGLGLLLLANKLLRTGFNHIPPVTLLSILAQVALYIGVLNPPWDRYEVCLSAEYILYYKDYRRLFLSAIEHANDFHLYHNMASFILKGRSLEARHGSLKFVILLLVFIFGTSGMYVALAKAAYFYTDDYSYMKQCAIGFSGVLFALKVLTTFDGPEREHWVHGFSVPSKYVVWVELLVIHILVPKASFMGHLAGILVGLLYLRGPLRLIVDAAHNLLTGTLWAEPRGPGFDWTGDRPPPPYVENRESNTYDRGTASFQSSDDGSHSYGWNTGLHQDTGPLDPDELRRRRMNRFS